jgi:CHAT domain-containing protein
MKLSQLATTVIIALTSSLFNPFHYGNFNPLGIASVLAEDVYVNQPQRPRTLFNSMSLSDAADLLNFIGGLVHQTGPVIDFDYTFPGSEADKKAIIEDLEKIENLLEKDGDQPRFTFAPKLGRWNQMWSSICSVYVELKEWDKAISACHHYLNDGAPFALTPSDISQNYNIVRALMALGDVYVGAGKYEDAINYLKQGLKLTERGESLKDGHGVGDYYLFFLQRIARIYFKLGNYSESVNYYRQELDEVLKNENGYIFQDGDQSGYFSIISAIKQDMAFALLNQVNLEETEKAFMESMNNDEKAWQIEIERTIKFQGQYSGFSSHGEVFAVSIYPYGLQELKVKQGKYNEALEFAERGRSRILSYLMSEELHTSITIPEIQQLARKKNATIVKYSWLQKPVLNTSRGYAYEVDYSPKIYIWVIQPSGQINFSQVDLSQPSINPQQTQVNSLARGISLNSNSSINSKLLITLGVLLIGISLSYFLLRHRKPLMIVGIVASGLTSSFLFFQQNQTPSLNIDGKGLVQLTKQTFATVRSNNRDTLSNAVTAKTCQDQNQCLDRLSQILINPIAKFLPKNPEESVIFIPDGELFRVPFAALKTADGKYLIEKHPIQISPSIQTLQLIDQESSNNTLNLTSNALIVGNPTMPKMENGQQLPALPGTEKEAEAISQMLGTQPLIGEQANIQNVTGQMPNADIIHLATHGNDQAIALAPANGQSGFLSGEIYGMHLRANLVVLSACDTGLGDITSDGVVGIARPFMAAGVKSVVVSLWSVPDAATSGLMIEFYNNLKTKPNKAQALQQAMLTIMKQHPEPVNWAGFILVGEAE